MRADLARACEENSMNDKLQYVAPVLVEVGSFEAITQTTNSGRQLDSNFNGRDLVNGTSN